MEFTDDRDEFNNDSSDDLPETETSTALVPSEESKEISEVSQLNRDIMSFMQVRP